MTHHPTTVAVIPTAPPFDRLTKCRTIATMIHQAKWFSYMFDLFTKVGASLDISLRNY